MSSVRPPSPESSQVYEAMTKALNEGKRIVYNTSSGKFETVSRDQAKKLGKNEKNYITELPALKAKVSEYIQKNGITTEQKHSLEKAFETRANKLAGRFVLFGSDERDQAVSNLKAMKTAIAASKTGSAAISTEVPPTAAPGTTQGPKLPSNQPAKKPGETTPLLQSGAPTPPQVPEATAGGPPPPPPPGGAGPKAPTGPTYSFTHKAVTTEADALKKLEGEPSRPQIDPTHDLGSPQKIPEERRREYADAIEAFVLGHPYEVSVPVGRTTKTEIKHKEDGLTHTLAPLKEELTQHSKDLEQLEGKRVQLAQTTRHLEVLNNRTKEMTKANGEGQPYVLYMKGAEKGTVGSPVTLQPDSAFQAFQTKFKALPQNFRELLTKKGAQFPEERTIGHQLSIIQKQVADLTREQASLESEITTIQAKIDKRSTLTNNKIPFNQWGKLVQDKEAIADRWLKIAGSLRKGTTPPAEKPKSADEAQLDSLLAELPLALEQVKFTTTLSSASMGAQSTYKSKPDDFLRALVGEDGQF